ncbi:hypothetical protein GJ496_011017 [Pomphorhynchus laevis]|nr:hypothetical protein GJ496_011017 [Pomphorhynchus laevis]
MTDVLLRLPLTVEDQREPDNVSILRYHDTSQTGFSIVGIRIAYIQDPEIEQWPSLSNDIEEYIGRSMCCWHIEIHIERLLKNYRKRTEGVA